MNSQKLARTTFVLLRETHDQLEFVARRMGVSRSELVRDVLAEPVALMAKWVQSLPEQPTAEDKDHAGKIMQLDMVEFIERKADEVRHGRIE
jgi:hypothetical protein